MIKYRIREHPEGLYSIEYSGGRWYNVWHQHCNASPSGMLYSIPWMTCDINAAKERIGKLKAEHAQDDVNRIVWEEEGS